MSKRLPHVTPRHLPPDEPPRESFAMVLLGVASIVVLFLIVFVVLPAAGVGQP